MKRIFGMILVILVTSIIVGDLVIGIHVRNELKKKDQLPLEPLDAVKAALKPYGYTNVMAVVTEKDGHWIAITKAGNLPCFKSSDSDSIKGFIPDDDLPPTYKERSSIRKQGTDL